MYIDADVIGYALFLLLSFISNFLCVNKKGEFNESLCRNQQIADSLTEQQKILKMGCLCIAAP